MITTKNSINQNGNYTNQNLNNNQQQKVIIYTRVSSVKIANSDYSIQSQIETCKSYCIKNNLEISKIITDCCGSRNSFQELLTLIENSKDKIVVVATSLDRITRNIEEFEKISKLCEIKVASIEQISEQKFTEDIFSHFAHNERQAISERIKAGIARKKILGHKTYKSE